MAARQERRTAGGKPTRGRGRARRGRGAPPAVRMNAAAERRAATARARIAATVRPDSTFVPDEILLQVFQSLSDRHLCACGQVCRQWAAVANDNDLWLRLYIARFNPKAFKLQNDWKRAYFRRAFRMRRSKCEAMAAKCHPMNELPLLANVWYELEGEFRKAFRVRWSLRLACGDGVCRRFLADSATHFSAAACLVWSHSDAMAPLASSGPVQQDVLASGSVFPGAKKGASPICRALMERRDGHDVGEHVLSTRLLAVHRAGHLVTAHWLKDAGESAPAFFCANMHYGSGLVPHMLAGSEHRLARVPAPAPHFDDIDSAFGLHDWTLCVALRNTQEELFVHKWPHLFTRAKDLCAAPALSAKAAVFSVITERRGCCEFAGSPVLRFDVGPVRETVSGALFLDVTVLDEHTTVFWCASTLVALDVAEQRGIDYEHSGEKRTFAYHDARAAVDGDLFWDEARERTVLTRLELSLSVDAINTRFGTDY